MCFVRKFNNFQKNVKVSIGVRFNQTMKQILIIGTGSIGSEIAFTFSNKYEITCIDHGKNFSKMKNQLTNINFVKGDINDLKLIKENTQNHDIVFYCIDTGGVVGCIEKPLKYYDINVTNFKKLIKTLKDLQLHFFLFSSIFVYADDNNITENTEPNPETIYGKLRLKQEQILLDSKLDFTILRLSNIFGYGNFFNVGSMGAIEKFIDCVFSGNKIKLHGDGKQKVDYLYKQDLMDLLKILIKTQSENKIYNVSTGVIRPIHEIANIIRTIGVQKFHRNIKIVKLDSNKKMPNLPLVFPQKIIHETTWKPSTNIEFRIEKMMHYYSKKIHNLNQK